MSIEITKYALAQMYFCEKDVINRTECNLRNLVFGCSKAKITHITFLIQDDLLFAEGIEITEEIIDNALRFSLLDNA